MAWFDTNAPLLAVKCAPPERRIPGVFPWSLEVKYLSKVVAAALIGAVLAGCTGTPMNTRQYDSSQYTVIGHSEATATGLMLFGVIPIRQNSRFVRAQEAAIQAKGGDAMINTQIQENWFWAWVLSGYTTKVSGDVVKLKTVQ
jgi:hypothetical protein